MNKHMKIIPICDLTSCLDDCTIEEAIKNLTLIKNEKLNGYLSNTIEVSYDAYGLDIELNGSRLETDKEYDMRVNKVKRREDQLRSDDLKKLKELQEKYGKDAV